MRERLYLLLDVAGGRQCQALSALEEMPEVIPVDCRDERSDPLVLMHGPDRARLAEILNWALAATGNYTDDTRVLVPRKTVVPAG